MRLLHRYLGFFLAGIMAVYALSGVTLIFRDTDIFKKKYDFNLLVETNLNADELVEAIELRRLREVREENGMIYFKEGSYNRTSGEVNYSLIKPPYVLDKMQHLHKARSSDPLFFLNIFFGLALLFFVISSFWMFVPNSSMFRKGMYFTAAGAILTLILVFI